MVEKKTLQSESHRDVLIEVFEAQFPSKLCFLREAVTPQKKHWGIQESWKQHNFVEI